MWPQIIFIPGSASYAYRTAAVEGLFVDEKPLLEFKLFYELASFVLRGSFLKTVILAPVL